MIKKHGGNVHDFAKRMNLTLDQIIDFSANINPLGMSKAVEAGIREVLTTCLHYPDPDYRDLLAAISQHEGVREENVILGNGAIECLFLLAEHMGLAHVHMQAPTFVEYERAFKKYGSRVTFDFLNHETFKNSPEDIIGGMPQEADLLVICNPNNPTGSLMTREEMISLLDYTRQRDMYLLVDEAFIDFTEDEKTYSLVDMIEDNPHLIILKSLTKFYGIPGLRLGYCLTANKVLTTQIKNNRIPWIINTVAEKAGILSLGDKAYIEATKTYMIRERQWMYDEMITLEGIDVFPSQGNYFFFKCLKKDLKQALAHKGLMIRACDNYRGLSDSYYRVAVKDHESNQVLIKALRQVLT